jgi:murein DD-endopeptidase MepM/ murein hydrolase activator NlpD
MIRPYEGLHSIASHRLEDLKGRKDPEAVKKAAQEMEALFAYEMLKAMRQTASMSPGQGLGSDFYTSIFDMEVARVLSERGLGVREMLLRSLRYGGEPQTTGGEAAPHHGGETSAPAPPPSDRNVTEALPVPSGLSVPRNDPTEYRLPVEGRITSRFGLRRHPILKRCLAHQGVDIAAPHGTEVHALRKGRVVFSGWQAGYGNTVIIDHGDGVTSKYAHNSENLVKAGDEVDGSTVIARVGSTGKSTGPHLHLEVIENGERVDPLPVLAQG